MNQDFTSSVLQLSSAKSKAGGDVTNRSRSVAIEKLSARKEQEIQVLEEYIESSAVQKKTGELVATKKIRDLGSLNLMTIEDVFLNN